MMDNKMICTELFENVVENNNVDNFAEPGTTVGQVPPGIGVLILASDDNEVHANEIRGNRSVAVMTFSYIEALFGSTTDASYDRFPQGNFIHDNTYEDNGTDPAGIIGGLSAIRPMPEILWDGCTDAAAVDDGHLTNCVSDATAGYLNFNYCDELPAESQDVAPVTCTYEPLPTE